MRDDTIRKVIGASSIGSIRCAREQVARCTAAANEELLTGLKEILARLESVAALPGAKCDIEWHSPCAAIRDFIGALIEDNAT